jgi:type VI secretion system protein ImpF
MARGDETERLVVSVFDRLLDDDPTSTHDERKPRRKALEDLRDGLRRDLEALLNTRPCSTRWSPALTELNNSILNYGVDSVTNAALGAAENRERFRSAIEQTIRRFETRFLRVNVTLVEDPERIDRTLRFRVEALVHAEPAPEPLIFDSAVDPSTQGVTVSSPRHV